MTTPETNADSQSESKKINNGNNRNIIISTLIAFALAYLGGTLSNTGWASDIAVAALGDSLVQIIFCGVLAAIVAAIVASVLLLAKKDFHTSFSKSYSVLIIIVSVVILIGKFPTY